MLNESDLLKKDKNILSNLSRCCRRRDRANSIEKTAKSNTHKMLKYRINNINNDRSLFKIIERSSSSINENDNNNNIKPLNGVITRDDYNNLEQSRLLATQQHPKRTRREMPTPTIATRNHRLKAIIFSNEKNNQPEQPLQQHHLKQQQHCFLGKSNTRQWLCLKQFLTIVVLFSVIQYLGSFQAKADDSNSSSNATILLLTETTTASLSTAATSSESPIPFVKNKYNPFKESSKNRTSNYTNGEDSIFLRFAKRFTTDNVLWNGLIRDCYRRPTFSCFQKNVYVYLNDVLEYQDVNVTQRLKFYQNQNKFNYQEEEEQEELLSNDIAENFAAVDQSKPTQSTLDKDTSEEQQENEIPLDGRGFTDAPAETPIEEVTNALYGKSIKFAMTHDIELKLPEMMFDGATFRISPKSIEGNGVIAKLELIPKQAVEARLAGKILMNKIKKILKSKLLLSFLALVLIIKIIKIKLFWLLPLIIGVGAAKKLLLKFLLFLFPALSHLFKLCSYYQQTYHSTKYHHHHHHINHHHTVAPVWQGPEHHHIPEIIYSHPPKGHVSAYLHGAPIHETYGPPSHENFGTAWENSGPGLGSEFISDINRAAQIDEHSNQFQPHSQNDENVLHTWGLGTTQPNYKAQKRPLPIPPAPQQNTLQKPPIQSQIYQKPQATSQIFNPFSQQQLQQSAGDKKQSFYSSKYRNNNVGSHSVPSPVYTPAKQAALPSLQQQQLKSQAQQIAAQYDPTRNQQQQLSPEVSAQLKEALRIQTEQRLIQQQQQILDKQPFVQDGQPLMPLNYDPFYSPILLKIDKILEQLGVNDDFCKERLVCSMYKDPERYSPHSNFVSAELSRDTNELQPVKSTNEAVLRFFRLIQAARDGQDQKNCLIIYTNCSINTE